MDKNTVIGFILIALILIGFGWMNRPSQEEIERRQRYNDSVVAAQQLEEAQRLAQEEAHKTASLLQDSDLETDSLAVAEKVHGLFGAFAPAALGEDKHWTLETDLLRLTFASKGGRLVEAELKEYKTHDSLPLILFTEEQSNLGFTIVTGNNRVLNTNDMYFVPVGDVRKDAEGNRIFRMRLLTDTVAYMDFVYTIPANDYMVGMSIESYQMDKVMPSGMNYLEMQWQAKIKQQERGRKFEERYSMVQYKFVADDVENLNASKNDRKMLGGNVM